MSSIREAWCGVSGHSFLFCTEPDRLYLKCVDCGHETPGWRMSGHPPRRR